MFFFSKDTANDTGDYVVINKEELAEYIKLQSKHVSIS